MAFQTMHDTALIRYILTGAMPKKQTTVTHQSVRQAVSSQSISQSVFQPYSEVTKTKYHKP